MIPAAPCDRKLIKDSLMDFRREFLSQVQEYVAITAIGPSSLRNQGSAGVIKTAREFMGKLDFAHFICTKEEEFHSELENATHRLVRALPEKAKSWGAARKGINLFLRDALYNQYLSKRYKIHSIENWLEVPLDRRVAQGLIALGRKGYLAGWHLPSWPGLKKLSPNINAEFQSFAANVAAKLGLARVHLDIYLWPEDSQ